MLHDSCLYLFADLLIDLVVNVDVDLVVNIVRCSLVAVPFLLSTTQSTIDLVVNLGNN